MSASSFDSNDRGGIAPPDDNSRRLGSNESTGEDGPARRFGNLRLLQIGTVVFLLPDILLAGGFGPFAAGMVLLGCVTTALLSWRSEPPRHGLLAAPIDLPTLAGCATLALVLLILGGETHLLYANLDWLTRDAVLSDLSRQGFPLFYRYEDQDYLLRAPLGMYLLPAAIGHFAGLTAAHVALLAQNAFLLALCLYFVAQLSKARKPAFLLVFVLFSGLDIAPQLLMHGLAVPDHLEWWNGFFQYSAHVTQLFWVPNHALPSWWFAVLLLLFMRGEAELSTLLAAFVATLLWSPLATIGAAPFLAISALRSWRVLFAPRNLIGAFAALCFLPVAVYLTIDAGSVRHMWLTFAEGFALAYLAFIVVEIPHAAIVFAAWTKIEAGDRLLIAAAIAVLLVLPFYSFGAANDLAMRASIVALFLLAFGFAKAATSTPRDGGLLASVISIIVIVSAATPLLEVRRAVVVPAFAISDCNLLTSWKKTDPRVFPTNYLARLAAVPAWLVEPNAARLEIEDRKCWPDHLLLDDSRK